MNEDYSQPFYVSIGKGKLNLHTGQRGGYYLPALEPKDTEEDTISIEPEWCKRQWDTVQQLKAQVLFLSDKVNKMRAKASKRKINSYTIKGGEGG